MDSRKTRSLPPARAATPACGVSARMWRPLSPSRQRPAPLAEPAPARWNMREWRISVRLYGGASAPATTRTGQILPKTGGLAARRGWRLKPRLEGLRALGSRRALRLDAHEAPPMTQPATAGFAARRPSKREFTRQLADLRYLV